MQNIWCMSCFISCFSIHIVFDILWDRWWDTLKNQSHKCKRGQKEDQKNLVVIAESNSTYYYTIQQIFSRVIACLVRAVPSYKILSSLLTNWVRTRMHNKNNGAEVTKLIYLSTYTYLVLPWYRKKPVTKKRNHHGMVFCSDFCDPTCG